MESIEENAILCSVFIVVLLSKVAFKEKVRKRTILHTGHTSPTHSRKLNLKHRVLVCTFSVESCLLSTEKLFIERGIKNVIHGLFLLYKQQQSKQFTFKEKFIRGLQICKINDRFVKLQKILLSKNNDEYHLQSTFSFS